MSPLDEKWMVTALHMESRFIKQPTLLSQRLHPYPNVIHGSALALMKNINEKASFNRCSSHSHDLCGKYSFSKTRCVTFFGTLESMYTFFSSSTHRWEVLKYYSGFFKRFCKTRWSAEQGAVETIISLSPIFMYMRLRNSLMTKRILIQDEKLWDFSTLYATSHFYTTFISGQMF